jgi:drug/metabolite transporter superfamily protein YnfA
MRWIAYMWDTIVAIWNGLGEWIYNYIILSIFDLLMIAGMASFGILYAIFGGMYTFFATLYEHLFVD